MVTLDLGRASLGLLVALAVGASCGDSGGSPADAAMDRSFAGGKAYPVHPPRGERKKVRRSGAQSMQSDPLECNGRGEQVLTNTELRVSAPTGVLVRSECHLRLVNVDLIADDGVAIDGGNLVMVGGSITAQGVAIEASGQASVELTDVELRGATGIQAGGQAKITTKKGKITGTAVALVLREEASAVLDATTLDGPLAQDDTAKLTKLEAGAGSGSAAEVER